jgi:hypothetical protein
MTEATNDQQQPVETPEQRDERLAAAYRAQFPDRQDENVDDKVDDDKKPQRPAHIPEKFWDAEKGEVNVEALAKSYSELEKQKAKPAAEDDANLTPEEKAAKEEESAKAGEAAAEFSKYRDSMTAKIVAGEDFTDADYAPAEKLGLTREDVDTFRAGLEAIGTLQKQSVYGEVGGQEKYEGMIEWARAEYTPDEVRAYDRDIHSSDPAVRLNAVRGLSARYALANGKSGKDVTSKGGKGAGEGYMSKAEMVADMRDPKYAKDPAFRQKVADKVAAARAAGRDLRV